MKNKIIVFLAIFCFTAFFSTDAQAQRKKKSTTDEYFDESGGFKHRLWYGGNINLNYTGDAFNIGVTPMVGYKIFEAVSVGPRFKIDYLWQRFQYSNGDNVDFKATTFGFGAFSRAKFLGQFFGHVEFEFENREVADLSNGGVVADPDDPTEILTERVNRNNFFLGAGYTSGTQIAYEMSILYNVFHPEDSDLLPIEIRVGFTYNF